MKEKYNVCGNCGKKIEKDPIVYVGMKNTKVRAFCSYQCKWAFQLKEVDLKYDKD